MVLGDLRYATDVKQEAPRNGLSNVALHRQAGVSIDAKATNRQRWRHSRRSYYRTDGGRQSWRRTVAHHMNSVLSLLSCSRLDRIQSATAFTQSVTTDRNMSVYDILAPARHLVGLPSVPYSITDAGAMLLTQVGERSPPQNLKHVCSTHIFKFRIK